MPRVREQEPGRGGELPTLRRPTRDAINSCEPHGGRHRFPITTVPTASWLPSAQRRQFPYYVSGTDANDEPAANAERLHAASAPRYVYGTDNGS